MREIKYVEVKSEIAAGTRGASLGIDALKIASLNTNSDYFKEYEAVEVDTENQVLFEGHDTPNARHIETVYAIEQRVSDAVSSVLKDGKFPLILAGDHSTAAGTISGIKSTHPDKRLGVIWIDAHADLHTPYTTPSGNMHGMPLAMVSAVDNIDSQINQPSEKELMYWEKLKAINEIQPKIDIKDIVFVVARDLEKPEIDLLGKHNIKNFTTDEVREIGIAEVAKRSLEQLCECDMVYISFDVDSMDSELSVGTGTPVPNGLTVEEAIELNGLLVQDPKVCAWEMVEVNPTLDTLNKMANNALRVLESTTKAIRTL